uniref:Large ribosomal subunit protein eL24-related N-terminal domain-containing protein n=1 Tax=Pseudictyota dubia TaxID=2749911 RepID=A0A7R9W543_9STRA|eukprot:TRINITY_DN77511_c0_g1_i1.p1 TRINITY_DN77511_c0_g1~~TRINITY_DN77511_c0_g1_i1.p1  ORF type:complete len:138 (-),score=35.56 TRINITY_DN77511_c0_g1_i1:234-626(-)
MVIKTDVCAFSENRIYPGHGSRFVRKDGQLAILSSSKCTSMYMQKKKPAKLQWTQAWRRLNKKANVEVGARRTRRRAVRVQRAVAGASLEDIKAKRNQKPEVRAKARDAALREIKARQKTAKGKKTGARR